ncbi:MAG: diaminopropionate ammonia-lyase [Rhodoferax sp.]|nr:diaminopropionate ammonia-lyase [Rhodoferax sp.]
MTLLINPQCQPGEFVAHPLLDRHAARAAAALLADVFDYAPTALVSLGETARRCGVASMLVKDEGARLGLKSFKALGGAYAVIRLVLQQATRQLGRPVVAAELPRPASGSLALPPAGTLDQPASADVAAIASSMTFACATDGNHGQSVAAGARLVGARAVIFVHAGVSEQRRQAIARFGCEMRVVKGSYDDAVAESARASAANGWTLLSDTAWPGYTDVPAWVMQGYTTMVYEIAQQLPLAPTHVFLHAGVGGFAAAVASCMHSSYQPGPRVVIVEPSLAACLHASVRAGQRIRIEPGPPTSMAMLECYEPSLLAWEVLAPLAYAFMTVEDSDAVEAVRVLAHASLDAEVVVSGESGSAGLAGFLVAAANPALREALALDASSRVLVFNTESATDESRYEAAVNTSAALVARGAAAS